MKVIGLSGNIGCGKSTVARMLSRRGVATIDADEVTRRVRETDDDARRAILDRFGTLVPSELGRLAVAEAAALAELVAAGCRVEVAESAPSPRESNEEEVS